MATWELRLEKLALEAANDGVLFTDPTLPDNPIVHASEPFLRLTGYERSEVVGRNCRFLQGPASDPAVVHRIHDAVTRGRPFDGVLLNYRKDGSPFWNQLRIRPVLDETGRIHRFVGIQTDVTARVEAERQLRAALEHAERLAADLCRERDRLDATSRAKDEFLAVASHELRTPLTAVLGFAEILESSVEPSDQRAAVATILRNARSELRLVDELLDISRIATARLELSLEPVALQGVVHRAVESMLPTAHAKRVTLAVEDETGPLCVRGDADRLVQVFWNLLSNGIKFTGEGGRVTIALRRERDQALVCVRDTGPGIAPDFLPHVFEPFQQASGTLSRRHGGLGLGLAIVKQVVEHHGGQVEAANVAEGHGAEFRVRLPLVYTD